MSCVVDIIKVIKGDPLYETYKWGSKTYDSSTCETKIEAYDTTGKVGVAQIFNQAGELVKEESLSFNFVDTESDNVIFSMTATDMEELDVDQDYNVKFKIDDANKPIYMPDEGKIIIQHKEVKEVSA